MNSTFIIAEAGVNHNGDINNAKRLIAEAKKAGADAVKFQTFRSEQLVSKYAQKAEYQKKTTGGMESQLDMIKKLELSHDDFKDIKKYCDEIGIMFLSTPFDLESIDFLNDLGMSIFKIPSGEITNLPYLMKIAKLGKKIIISTGMSSMKEVSAAIDILKRYGVKDITVLHCNTEYPTPYSDVNLSAMLTLKEELNITVGYSDHTLGIEVSIAAVALGARVIEKHFTLDKDMKGPDHRASLEPYELSNMVKSIRNLEIAIGNGEKIPSVSEQKNIIIARKSIVAIRDIKCGELFTENNITTKRPGNGISPMLWFEVLGQRAIKDFKEDELIML